MIGSSIPNAMERQSSERMIELFFKQKKHSFKDFTDKETPNAINKWLSCFYVLAQSQAIYLMVNEKRSLIARLSSPHFKKYLPNTLLFEDIYNYLPQIFFFLLALFKSLKLLQRKKLYLELYQNPIFNIKLYFVFM